MNTVRIDISGKDAKVIELQVPTAFNELNSTQIEAVANFRLGDVGDVEQAKQIMLIALLGLDKKELNEVMELLLDSLQDVSLLDLYPLMNWLTEDVIWEEDLYPVPKGFVAIGGGFKNICLQQFFTMEFMWFTYRKEPTNEHLNKILASVYPFRAFEIDKIEQDAELFDEIHVSSKKALLLNFIAQRNHFTEQYPSLFPKPEKDQEEKNEDPDINFYEQLMDMVFDLPSDQFGTFVEKLKMPMHNAFMYMEKLKRDALKKKPNEV